MWPESFAACLAKNHSYIYRLCVAFPCLLVTGAHAIESLYEIRCVKNTGRDKGGKLNKLAKKYKCDKQGQQSHVQARKDFSSPETSF